MGASRSPGRGLVWALVLACLGPTAPIVTHAATRQVNIADSVFTDAVSGNSTSTIAAGDTVNWNWVGVLSHTTTSGGCPGGICTANGLWSSPLQISGPDFPVSIPFQTVGTYPYFCTAHGSLMTGTVVVNPGALHHFNVIAAVTTTTAGNPPFNVAVTARDQFNNLVSFNGSVNLSITNEHPTGEVAATTTLSGGVGNFSVTPKTSGTRTITVTSASITGSDTVTVNPAATSQLVLTAPGTASPGVAVQVTVTARDQFDNVTPAYGGTVHFTSSDLAASLPANNTLISGTRTFSVTFATPGSQTLTVADTINGTLTDTKAITVNAACSTTFTNTSAITIPAGAPTTTSGPATPYPSTIVVGGLKQTINGMSVTLNGLTHTFPADIDVLLVGPGGQKMIIMSDAGTSLDVNNITFTLADSAAALLPSGTVLTEGTFKPTDHLPGADPFAVPAPAGPYSDPAPAGTATFASVFNGANPNGTWSLYVVDDAGADVGNFSGGWSLTFAPPANTFCNQTVISLPTLGPSAPYPSELQVSNLDGTIKNASVRLDKLNKTSSFLGAFAPTADFDMLLVGPDGSRKMIILSDVGSGAASDMVLTLDDSGAAPPAALTSGIFVPSNVGAADLFPAPAPSGPYADPALGATFGSTFNGSNPNGTWKLHIVDDLFHPGTFPFFIPESPGNIAGGWALTFDLVYNTTTTLTSNLNPSFVEQVVNFTATVTSAGGTPTGTVTFKQGVFDLITVPLVNGSAGIGVQAQAGTHNFTATYNGSSNFFHPSTSNTVVQVVNPAPTSTSVVSSLNPSTFGQSVTFTATVSDQPGFVTPTGTVTFMDGAVVLGSSPLTGTPPAPRIATLTTSALTGGSHAITAVYNGNSNFATSTSPILTQAVNKANTTTAVVSGTNPSTFGGSVTFTATVSESTGGTPTGSVVFKDGVTTIGTGTLNGSAVATLTTSSLTAGGHSITAVYNGDGNFNTSTSSAITQTVNKATPTASVISFQNPSSFGQDVPFRADVLGTGVTPTGTITFKDGGTTLGTIAVQPDGTALFNTATLSGGNHNITVVYNGDSNYNTATSSNLVQEVLAAETFTDLATSGTPSTFGQVVTFTATVTSSAGTPSGTVSFKDGATVLGTTPLNGGGTATFLTSTLAAGSHSITALYNSNGNFSSSTSSPVIQTVNQAATTVMISATKDKSGFREAVTFTVTVIPTTSGTPSGTVTFFDGPNQLGSPVSLNGSGQAQITIDRLTIGRHGIMVQYSGDVNFPANSSVPLEHYRSPKPR